MTDVLGRFVERIPTRARSALRGTIVDELYNALHSSEFYGAYRIRSTELVRREFETPIGPVDLLTPPESYISEAASRPGGHEPGLVDELGRVLTPNSTFYDVGCQYGYITAIGLALGVPPERVHAFEANRFAHHVFERNFESTEVRLTRAWVGADSGDRTLAIDDYVKAASPPDVVKVDVEGAEHEVIRGARRTLKRHRPTLFVEMHPELLPKFDTNESSIIETLREIDYEVQVGDKREASVTWHDVHANGVGSVCSASEYLLRARRPVSRPGGTNEPSA